MNTEIMSEVLSKLNRYLKRQKRNIFLFMDNAPCHPESLQHIFSNIKIVFLPKNTTSKTQLLDAGIIALSDLLTRLDASCTAYEHIAEEDDLEVCQPTIDSSYPNWRQTVRDYALKQYYNTDKEDIDAMEDEDVENFEINNEEPEIKSLADTIEHAEQLRTFAQYDGYQELSLAMSLVNNLLYKQKLQMPKCQASLSDFLTIQ